MEYSYCGTTLIVTSSILGYTNYGVLFGLTNVIVSSFQYLQTSMFEWAEHSVVDNHFIICSNANESNEDLNITTSLNAHRDYVPSNILLWVATIPLFVTVINCNLTRPRSRFVSYIHGLFLNKPSGRRTNDIHVYDGTSLL